jgi:hypothetical protein
MADAKHQKPVFLIGMFRVVIPNCILVLKHGAGFFKSYAMFPLIAAVLGGIPLEVQIFICTVYLQSTRLAREVDTVGGDGHAKEKPGARGAIRV